MFFDDDTSLELVYKSLGVNSAEQEPPPPPAPAKRKYTKRKRASAPVTGDKIESTPAETAATVNDITLDEQSTKRPVIEKQEPTINIPPAHAEVSGQVDKVESSSTAGAYRGEETDSSHIFSNRKSEALHTATKAAFDDSYGTNPEKFTEFLKFAAIQSARVARKSSKSSKGKERSRKSKHRSAPSDPPTHTSANKKSTMPALPSGLTQLLTARTRPPSDVFTSPFHRAVVMEELFEKQCLLVSGNESGSTAGISSTSGDESSASNQSQFQSLFSPAQYGTSAGVDIGHRAGRVRGRIPSRTTPGATASASGSRLGKMGTLSADNVRGLNMMDSSPVYRQCGSSTEQTDGNSVSSHGSSNSSRHDSLKSRLCGQTSLRSLDTDDCHLGTLAKVATQQERDSSTVQLYDAYMDNDDFFRIDDDLVDGADFFYSVMSKMSSSEGDECPPVDYALEWGQTRSDTPN
mmetsp:Transcript_1673/g.2650  ORF Transcript_1673/g.2650 Transcript_1673/m.2650 type:complete len:463 (+) Transcript_1673:86-1474(+)